MIAVLWVLVIYVLVCMAFTTTVLTKNLNKLSDDEPLLKTRDDLFVLGTIYVLATSPFWMPGVVVRMIRALWQEIIDRYRSMEEGQF
jgi:hypothetical protein